jgi:hypothetical protein
MLLLFSNPRVGLSLALETGVSAGEGADLIDVDGKRAVRFRDSPIISHASDMVCSQASANRGQAQRSRGSRFKAVNTRDKNYTPGAIRLRIEQVDASIARYLGMLDTADHQDRALLAAADQVSARLAAALDGEHGADIIGLARSAAAK